MSSTILMGKLMSKLKPKLSPEITTGEIQAGKFTTSQKVNVYFYFPDFSETKIVPWTCRADNKTNSRYNLILGRDQLIALGLDKKISENIIIGGVRNLWFI